MRPTHAIMQIGTKLQGNGADIASTGNDVTKWKHIPIEYDPLVTYSSVSGSCSDARTWLASFSDRTLTLGIDALTFQMVDNGVATDFTRDNTVSEAIYLASGANARLQVEVYPGGAARCRLRYKLTTTTNLTTSYIRVNGFTAAGSALNTGRGGSWDGSVNGLLTSSALGYVKVMDAVEKFPRGYVASGSNLDITLHDSSIPEDTSIDNGVYDLSGIIAGNLDLTLPATYQAMLANPAHPVRGAALEIAAVNQTEPYQPVHISIDFWISLDSEVTPTAPLVFLDGYESDVWKQIDKNGLGNEDLLPVEERLLGHANSWLEVGPRGQLCYGDFPHQAPFFNRNTDVQAWSRIRMNNHYFHITGSWWAFLRTGNPEWYFLSRVFANYDRDGTWATNGGKTHAKTLAPYGGNWSLTGHNVDSESILYSWLIDHDYHALNIYKAYLAFLLTYPLPSGFGFRDASVNVRQLDVAYWFSGVSTYLTNATSQRAMLMGRLYDSLALSYWEDYRYLDPLYGPMWTSYWLKEAVPEYDFYNYEGIFAVRLAALNGDLGNKPRNGETPEKSILGHVKYGKHLVSEEKYDGYNGPGLLGENLLCQINDIYYYLQDKRLDGKMQMLYGSNSTNGVDTMTYIKFTKTDDNPSEIRMLYQSRNGGNLPPAYTYLTPPDGPEYNILGSGVYVPHYIDITTGGDNVYLPSDMSWVELQGLQIAFQKIVPFTGPAGEYTIRIHSAYMAAYGPMTVYYEWQEIDEEVNHLGWDEEGYWPAAEGIIFHHASGYVEEVPEPVYMQQSQAPSVLYGVNSEEKFKVNVSLLSGSKRKRGNVLHLSKAKTKLSTVFALFDAIVHGICLDTEEFEYVSDDQLLTITNVSGVTGIVPHVSAGIYAIPLFPAVDYGVAFSTIHLPKIPTATGGV